MASSAGMGRDEQRLTLAGYLAGEETNRRSELAWGVLREPPAPSWDHQRILGCLFRKLDEHVSRLGLGKVGVSPVDVILDADRHLVLQPDVVFVAAERCGIIRDRIWGPPDLVIEVLSPDSRRYDREQKRGWYQQYGVREEWLVDPASRVIDVCDLIDTPSEIRSHAGAQIVRSRVLPRLRLRVSSVFAHPSNGAQPRSRRA